MTSCLYDCLYSAEFPAGDLLAEFTYDRAGRQLQGAKITSTKAYQYVMLKVLSNWGDKDKTCIYRFRLHGPAKE